jgi:A/G-specific adenine glycosylase
MRTEIKQDQIEEFQQIVWAYYDAHGRHGLPWRLTDDPYKIWVSEMMLQQTQVNRVIVKYEGFLRRFPDVTSLATASLGDVLIEWQGLGYNRRAKYLWEACKLLTKKRLIKDEPPGSVIEFPDTLEELVKLPGIGPNTAGAIRAYAFNKPSVFIETNIRTVFIHHFFADQTDVSDKPVRELAEAALPKANPKKYRDWYWALMDYGTHIKQTAGNKSRASKYYNKQSKFEGSKRQIRGAVIRNLSRQAVGFDHSTLQERIGDERLDEVLRELQAEGMVSQHDGQYRLC